MLSFVRSFVWLNLDTSATANVWFNSDFILLSEFNYTYLHQASKHQQQNPCKKQNWTPSVRRYPHWHLFSPVSFFPVTHTFILFLFFYHVSIFSIPLFLLLFYPLFFSTTLLLFFLLHFFLLLLTGAKLLLLFLFLYLHPNCYLFSCYFFSCYFFSYPKLLLFFLLPFFLLLSFRAPFRIWRISRHSRLPHRRAQ